MRLSLYIFSTKSSYYVSFYLTLFFPVKSAFGTLFHRQLTFFYISKTFCVFVYGLTSFRVHVYAILACVYECYVICISLCPYCFFVCFNLFIFVYDCVYRVIFECLCVKFIFSSVRHFVCPLSDKGQTRWRTDEKYNSHTNIQNNTIYTIIHKNKQNKTIKHTKKQYGHREMQIT